MRYIVALCAMLAAVPLAAQPVITAPGAVNAASYAPAGLQNSAIAQGSIFIVFGKNLGPASIVSANYPLTTILAGTSAQVTVNGITVSPLMIYTLTTQVAMLMPSSTPTGSGTITINYNGQTSAPAPVQVTAASFGIFSMNQGGNGPAVVTDANYAYISLTHAASAGQSVILWGTGLGKISADETQPPPQGNVGVKPTVWVGSQQANVSYWGRAGCCGGLDQINFQVPAGTTGCYVPVTVQTGSTVSNFGSISVAGTGSVCSDAGGLSATQLIPVQNGQNLRVAALSLSRTILSQSSSPSAPPFTTTTDSGSASFLRYTPSQLTTSGFGQAVSLGYCTVFGINGTATVTDPVQPQGLDAGSFELGGTNGTMLLQQPNIGYYRGSFGSKYLDVGHTVNGFGGADVGSILLELQMPPLISWTNQSNISTVSESQGVTLNWTNAVPGGIVNVTGYSFSLDQSGSLAAGASFYCKAPAGSNGTGQFSIPQAVLLSLPVSSASGPAPSGFLGIGSSKAAGEFLLPRGIDVGFAQTSVQILRNVTYTP